MQYALGRREVRGGPEHCDDGADRPVIGRARAPEDQVPEPLRQPLAGSTREISAHGCQLESPLQHQPLPFREERTLVAEQNPP